jgi:hypothetical protein
MAEELRSSDCGVECSNHDQQHECPTFFLAPGAVPDPSLLEDLAGRILGHLYAEAVYAEAQAFELKSGISTKEVQQELAVSYGFCSRESTLLMLYDAGQFKEHGILPPVGHPTAESVPREKKKEVSPPTKGYAPGEVGGRKTTQQRAKVVALADRMNDFFKPSPQPPMPKQMSPASSDLSLTSFLGCSSMPSFNTAPIESQQTLDRTMDDLWLKRPATAANDLNLPTLEALLPLTGAPMSNDVAPKEQPQRDVVVKEAVDCMRKNEPCRHCDLDLLDIEPLTKLTGCVMPSSIPAPNQPSKVVFQPVMWLRNNNPCLDDIDQPVVQAFSNLASYPISRSR